MKGRDDVTADWRVGNAAVDGGCRRGWFLGHFFPDEHDVRHSDAVEVKWAQQGAGDERGCWVTHETRTTLLLLVEGHFRITFSRGAVELTKRGDYAVWGPGVDHTWRALTDSVVITVRWPSL
jgi:hypothetical protein